MSRRRSLALATAVPLVVALMVPSGAAVAEQMRSRLVLTDPTGDVWAIAEGEDAQWASAGDVPTADVVRAVVRHGRRSVVVRMAFAELRRLEAQTYSVTFVTPEHYGAVFVQAGPQRWRGRHLLVNEQFGRVKCSGLRHHIDYRSNQVTTVLPRRCIGRPAWVRVSMSNVIFRGQNEDDFQEITDNPHTAGHEDALTSRVYRRTDAARDVVRDDFDGDDRVLRVHPDWANGDITDLRAAHRRHRVTARLTFVALTSGPHQPWAYHTFRFRTNEQGWFELRGTVGVDSRDPQGQWRLEDGRRVTCAGLRHTIDYRAHTVRVSVPRGCLGDPTWVRVGADTATWSEPKEAYHSDDALRRGTNARITEPAPPERPSLGPRLRRG